MAEQTFIFICANCQAEFPQVKEAVKKAGKERPELAFSHGICSRHYAMWMKQLGKSDADIEARVKKGGFQCPDLKEHPELVRQYSEGIFTPEDYKNAQSPIDPSTTLKEFFKKRAGMMP